MKSFFITFLLLFSFSAVFGQKYPIPVRPGDTLIIKAKKNYNIPLKDDTLWVMKNSQLQNAIIKAKKLEICEDEISEYKKEIGLHIKKENAQDSLNDILTKDRDYYMNTWKTCDQDIQRLGNMHKRQKLMTKIAIGAIPVAFVLGLLIKL